MAFDYGQFAAMGDPAQQKPGPAQLGAMAADPNQPAPGTFSYDQGAVWQPPSGGVEQAPPGGGAPAPAGGPTYTAQQFSDWYQGQFGNPIDQGLLGQIGTAVGPAQGGVYSQAQWDQGQQLARQQAQNAKPFFPEFDPPKFEGGPAYQAPKPFEAPTMEEAENDAGYQFAVKQGMGALQNAQAARGMARTGGALKALMDYGQQAASQQYDKVYDRAAQNYARDYQMGRDTWNMNEDAKRQAFDRNYRGASDAFNARFRGKEMTFEDLYRRWALNTNIQAQMALAD